MQPSNPHQTSPPQKKKKKKIAKTPNKKIKTLERETIYLAIETPFTYIFKLLKGVAEVNFIFLLFTLADVISCVPRHNTFFFYLGLFFYF